MLKPLTIILVFFSIAQPGVIVPALEEYRIFFLLSLFALILYIVKPKEGRLRVHLPQNKYIYGMVIAYTFSEAQYFWLSGTIDVFSFWLKKILLFFLVIHIIETERDLKRILWTILLAACVLIVMGWEMYWYEPNLLANAGRLQSIGNYNLSNSFALLLAVVFPLAFCLMEVEDSLLKKLFLMVFMLVVVISCVYTKSRGGALGTMAGVVLSILFSRKYFTSKPIKITLSATVVMVFIVFGVKLILSRADATTFFGTEEQSAGDRLMAWTAAIRMFIDHPIFGVGWAKFPEYAFAYGMDKRLLAHNTFISVLAETGIVGFVCFIGMVFFSFKQVILIRRAWSRIREKQTSYIIANGILISFICFFINTSFSVKDHDPMFWTLLTLIGILSVMRARELTGPESLPKGKAE
ncbi:MAG TPA: O-antigen ligase family protein [Syntrophorhabdaceae bacterium]|nr:O-antigen ligase family protein [Syntrophorhabdaceae bacterium]